MNYNYFKKVSILLVSILLIYNVVVFSSAFADSNMKEIEPEFYWLGGKVWYDKNSNGIQDQNENGIEGVNVRLLNSQNTVISGRITDSNGEYNFLVTSADYSVIFDSSTFPSNYFETKRNYGTDDRVDSDGIVIDVTVIDKDVSNVDLGITDKPYNVRVSHKTQVVDINNNVIGYINRNTLKTVYHVLFNQNADTIYKVYFNGQDGFIKRKHTDYYSVKLPYYNVRLKENLTVFDSPDGSSIGLINKNTVKTVYGKVTQENEEVWYRVWYNGGPGYIKAQYTKKLDYNVRVTDKTKVRAYPRGPALTGYLYKNKIKTAYGYKTDNYGAIWYRIWYNGQYAYLYKLCTSKNLASVPDFNVKTNVPLNVRDGVWGPVLGTLPKNKVKTVYGQRLDRDGDTWYRVWYNGGPAYMKAKYTTRQ